MLRVLAMVLDDSTTAAPTLAVRKCYELCLQCFPLRQRRRLRRNKCAIQSACNSRCGCRCLRHVERQWKFHTAPSSISSAERELEATWDSCDAIDQQAHSQKTVMLCSWKPASVANLETPRLRRMPLGADRYGNRALVFGPSAYRATA
jgi:hypothetical protein